MEDQQPAPLINSGGAPASARAVVLPARKDWPAMPVGKRLKGGE